MDLDNENQILSVEQVARMQTRLDGRQCEILFRRIGHGYHRIQSLTYIAKDFKLSRERIRQIQNESLLKLNDPTVTHLVLLAETKATYERNERRRDKFIRTLSWLPTGENRKIPVDSRVKFGEAYEPWSEDEDRKLWKEIKEGKSMQEIAKLHARSIGAIRSRVKKIKEGKVVISDGSEKESD
jgi:hypothetical protein